MYVEAWVNHKLVKSTIVDSGATHNFMTESEANRLNIMASSLREDEGCQLCGLVDPWYSEKDYPQVRNME